MIKKYYKKLTKLNQLFNTKTKKKNKEFFIVKATEYALSILEDKLNLEINCEFEEQISTQKPILFVANHFTRSETLIMPYILKKYTGGIISTLADKTLFYGKFLQSFLDKARVVSTGDANRDDKIIADLLSGDQPWMIYPEGQMTKDKNVFVNYGGKDPITSAKTGSAVIALKTEILREQILKNQITYNGKVSKEGLVIIPVSITYHPLNFTQNWLEDLIKKPLKRTSSRLNEELRVETSILTNSKIDLHFGKPIEVSNYIKNERNKINFTLNILQKNDDIQDCSTVLGQKICSKDQKIIESTRHILTANAMKKVYDNVLVTMEHIFSCLVFCCIERKIEKISVINTKNLLAKCYFDITKRFENQYRFDEYKNEFELIASKNFEIIINLCISQNLLCIENDTIILHFTTLTSSFDFHQIRVKNILKVLHNEINYFNDIKLQAENFFYSILKTKNGLEKLNSVMINKIYDIDLQNFEADYQKYFNSEETKSKKITSPLFMNNEDKAIASKGIVLCHGYKSAPEEMRLLGDYLHKNGFVVYLVRLKGHGTGSENMKYIQYQDWIDSMRIGYEVLSRSCDKIFIGGFSTGGLVSLTTAYNSLCQVAFGKKIEGIICINAALKIADIKFKFVRFAKLGIDLINKFKSKQNELKDYVVDEPENPHINYNKNYINGLNELSKLIEHCDSVLPQIKSPCFVIQGDEDPVVTPQSGQLIFDKIASTNKKLYMPKRKRHVIVRGAHCDEIFDEIAKWLASF